MFRLRRTAGSTTRGAKTRRLSENGRPNHEIRKA